MSMANACNGAQNGRQNADWSPSTRCSKFTEFFQTNSRPTKSFHTRQRKKGSQDLNDTKCDTKLIEISALISKGKITDDPWRSPRDARPRVSENARTCTRRWSVVLASCTHGTGTRSISLFQLLVSNPAALSVSAAGSVTYAGTGRTQTRRTLQVARCLVTTQLLMGKIDSIPRNDVRPR